MGWSAIAEEEEDYTNEIPNDFATFDAKCT
jgi:hypothetical protein